jgi:hypothetical protein
MNPLEDMGKDRLRSESEYSHSMSEDSLKLMSVYDVETKTFPYKTMILIVSTSTFVILITFLKGGSGTRTSEMLRRLGCNPDLFWSGTGVFIFK